MFLIERVFGLSIYAILLVVVLLLIERHNSNYKIILSFYAISLAIIAFYYLPYKAADLYRIYKDLDQFSKYSWEHFFSKRLNGNILQIDLIYYWLIAQTGEPRLLPAINTFVCYSCVFYIIIRTAKIYKIGRNNIAISLFFFMAIGNYMFVISGIRNMLGICLLCFCFFRESIEKKFKIWHILVYFMAGFIHSFVFILVFMRLLIHIFSMRTIFKKFIYLLFVGSLLLGMLYVNIGYVRGVFNKAEKYITGEFYSYEWEYVIGGLTGIILIITLHYFTKNKKLKKDLRESSCFLIACLIIAFVFVFEFTIFHRSITYIAPIIGIPLLMITLQREQQAHKKNFKNIIFSLTVILLIVVCARGSLCGLKFFVL